MPTQRLEHQRGSQNLCTSPKVEITQLFTNRQMDKQTAAYPCKGISPINKKEKKYYICYKDESQSDYTQCEKPA